MKANIICFGLSLASQAYCAPTAVASASVEPIIGTASRPASRAEPPSVFGMTQKVIKASAAMLDHRFPMHSMSKTPADSEGGLTVQLAAPASGKKLEEEPTRRRKISHHGLQESEPSPVVDRMEEGVAIEPARLDGMPCHYARRTRGYDDKPAVFLVFTFFLLVVVAELGGGLMNWIRLSLSGQGAIRLEEDGAESQQQPISIKAGSEDGSAGQDEKNVS